MTGLISDKQRLRAQLLEHREELSARDPDAGEALAAKFPMKLLERYGPSVAAYMPIRCEIDPRPLIGKLESAGAQMCLPVLENSDIVFRRWSTGDPLIDGRYGLREPMPDAEICQPTLVLVPLLGFDRMGNRLGYGAGYYDRALAALRAQGRSFACGIAFNGQLLEDIPSDGNDQPLDWAVTEVGSYPIFMTRNLTTSQN